MYIYIFIVKTLCMRLKMKATKKQIIFFIFVFILLFIILPFTVKSETYEVGEGMPYENISSVTEAFENVFRKDFSFKVYRCRACFKAPSPEIQCSSC